MSRMMKMYRVLQYVLLLDSYLLIETTMLSSSNLKDCVRTNAFHVVFYSKEPVPYETLWRLSRGRRSGISLTKNVPPISSLVR